jgi:hypothetical protein
MNKIKENLLLPIVLKVTHVPLALYERFSCLGQNFETSRGINMKLCR